MKSIKNNVVIIWFKLDSPKKYFLFLAYDHFYSYMIT